MKVRWILAILMMFSLSGAVFSSEKAPMDAKTRYSPENFKKQVELAKAGKPADYLAMRLAYTRTPQYNPYERTSYEAMKNAYYGKKYEEAIKLGQGIIDWNFVDMDAHMVLSLAFAKTGNKEKALFHRKMVENLVRSIGTTGDGKTQKSAFLVINIREEYILLKFMGVEKTGKKLEQGQNQVFDVMEVKDKGGKTGKVYFNITIPFTWLSANLKKAK